MPGSCPREHKKTECESTHLQSRLLLALRRNGGFGTFRATERRGAPRVAPVDRAVRDGSYRKFVLLITRRPEAGSSGVSVTTLLVLFHIEMFQSDFRK
jgi:hypothetical protein